MHFLRHRVLIFILVGSGAALIHFLSVVLLVEIVGMAPLLANVGGWMCAFGFSYGGHRWLTFADHEAPVLRSFWRFFLISASGFSVNESAYAILLHVSHFSYQLLLAIVLVGVALFTYLLSRHWAFATDKSR